MKDGSSRFISNRGPTSASWICRGGTLTKTWCLRYEQVSLGSGERETTKSAPERDKIILIRERHHPLTVFLRHGEHKFQHISYTLAKRRSEIFHDEMRVLLRDGRFFVGSDIVSQLDVRKCEVHCWPVGKVRYNHRVCGRTKMRLALAVRWWRECVPGTPRCSCRTTRSVTSLALHASASSLTT